MDKTLTPSEAWTDFFNWIKTSEKWSDISRQDRQYMYVADSHFKHGKLGAKRIQTILTKHAPERYEFRSVVILHQ